MPRTDRPTAAPPDQTHDVAAAEQEAAEAEQLAAALEERVREGDDTVTPEQVTSQRELGRFARLRVEAARRKAARAAEAARLERCKTLAADINAYAEGSGQKFADLLHTAEDAVRAFLTAVDERNDHIRGWRQEMTDLGVPAHGNPTVPSKEHGQLGHFDHPWQIIAGHRRMIPVRPEMWVSHMLSVVLGDPGTALTSLQVPWPGGSPDAQTLYSGLAAIDAPQAEPDSTGKFFYRGPGGAVVMYDKPFSREDVKRLDLTPVSAKDAWGE